MSNTPTTTEVAARLRKEARYEDKHECPWCFKPIDLSKTYIDILLRKFDINEALVKAKKRIEQLEEENEDLKAELQR